MNALGTIIAVFHIVCLHISYSGSRMVLYDDVGMSEQRRRFDQEYLFRTGRLWSNYWPRPPVSHHFHRAKIGEKIVKESDRSQFFVCTDDQLGQETISALDAMEKKSGWVPRAKTAPPSFQVENDGYYIGRMNGTTYCREKVDPEQLLSWDLINICDQGPNAFRIYNFISDDEIEHIKNLGMDLGMVRSTVQATEARTQDRTSQTVWINRDKSFIVDNIIQRIANMVDIPQEKLFLNASAESLQLVHYHGGELYKAHHDYTVEKPHARYITFLMYLNDVAEGGNTSFPRADESCKNDDGYLGVQPIKGSVAWFYDLLPDGNVDDKTLHYAEPPVDSEKWMTNLWIWDKIFARGKY